MPRMNLYTKSNYNEDYRKNISHRINMMFPKEIDVNLTDKSISKINGIMAYQSERNKFIHIKNVIWFLVVFILMSVSIFIILNYKLFKDVSLIELLKEYLYSSLISVIIMVVSAIVFGLGRIKFKRWN